MLSAIRADARHDRDCSSLRCLSPSSPPDHSPGLTPAEKVLFTDETSAHRTHGRDFRL